MFQTLESKIILKFTIFWQHCWSQALLLWPQFTSGQAEHSISTSTSPESLASFTSKTTSFSERNFQEWNVTRQLARYKIQQDKNFPVSPAKVWKVAKHVLVNQVPHQNVKSHPMFRLYWESLLGWPPSPCGRPGPPPLTPSPPSPPCRWTNPIFKSHIPAATIVCLFLSWPTMCLCVLTPSSPRRHSLTSWSAFSPTMPGMVKPKSSSNIPRL